VADGSAGMKYERAAESTVVRISPDRLGVSAVAIARYAGGTRSSRRALEAPRLAAALASASRLVRRAFVYSVHGVEGMAGDVRLESAETAGMSPCVQEPTVMAIAVCVCTLGGMLEQAERRLMSSGKGADGLLLDAAGVAFLDVVSVRAWDRLRRAAEQRGLHCSRRFGPGYGGLELSVQAQLFRLVDASCIGVRLNESCVMVPGKSLSFFTRWTVAQPSPAGLNKCTHCDLTDCLYRCERPTPCQDSRAWAEVGTASTGRAIGRHSRTGGII